MAKGKVPTTRYFLFLFLKGEAMNKYVYEGPVMYFDKIIDRHYRAETMAKSAAKARSNLTYSYKRKYGYEPYAAISLPGDIELVDGNNPDLQLSIEI